MISDSKQFLHSSKCTFLKKLDSYQKTNDRRIVISSVNFIQCNTSVMHITTFPKMGWLSVHLLRLISREWGTLV